MRDIELYNDGRIVFCKKMWHDSEITLAKCYNFSVDFETGTIIAMVGLTFKKAIYHFIKLSFKSFSEALDNEARRNDFYSRLDAMYELKDNSVTDIMKVNLPYYDKFYQHQKDTLMQAFYHKHFFGALDMGLGKTAISASISRMMQAECTLIVCPAAVKWNWFRDLTSKLWGFNELFFTILDRTKRRTITALNERFIIVNYDIIGNYEKYFATKNVRHIIFDESHYLKNHNSLRYKAVKKIVDLFPEARITFLSGTPVANRVNDIFAYLKLINHELGHSHKKFISEFTVTTSGRGGERVTGGKNLQDLNIKLANFMIRKTKEECLDLPGKIFLSYRFELDDYRDEYDKIIEEMSQRKEFKNLNSDLHSLNILTSKAKLPGIKELAETIIESGKKVVIFGSYREPINELQEYFKERCVKIDGSVDSFTRDQHIQKFHNDPECVVFLGNMRAAGVGINLTNASDVIFVNFPFTVAELYQATDRCDRIGQKFAVNVHYTFCDESIDEYIYEIIVDKEKDINALIDQGKEAVLRENTTEILIKKLLNRKNLDDIDYTDYTPIEDSIPDEEEKNPNNHGATNEDSEEGGLGEIQKKFSVIPSKEGEGEIIPEIKNGNIDTDKPTERESSEGTEGVGQAALRNLAEAEGFDEQQVHSRNRSNNKREWQHPDYPAKGYDSTVGFPKLQSKPKTENVPIASSISESFEDMQQLVQHMNDNGSQFIPNEPKGVVTDDMVKKSWEHLENNKVKAPGRQITLEEGIEEATNSSKMMIVDQDKMTINDVKTEVINEGVITTQSFVVNQPPPTFILPKFD